MSNITIYENLEKRLIEINNKPVLLAKDVAELYNVETRVLNQNIKKNIELFPEEFRFKLTDKDVEKMVSSQMIPSKSVFGGHLPYVFTEEGLYMVATILRSELAKEVHFHIVKTFSKLRKISKNIKEVIEIDNPQKQTELIQQSNELLHQVIDTEIVEEKALDKKVKKVTDEIEINLGILKFKRTIENKDKD